MGELQAEVTALVEAVPVRWGISVALDGDVVVRVADGEEQPIASVGKVVLLVEVADRLRRGELDGHVSRVGVAPVADSGLWQHFAVEELPVADVAALVGAVSDNLATNVLLREVGLDAVRERGRQLGLATTVLHDVVRDVRGPDVPPQLASGTASELQRLVERIAADDVGDPGAGALVARWLSLDTDLSMVAGGFDLDPLAHHEPDAGVQLWHKTGTDVGVRADVGCVVGDALDR